MTRLRKRKSGAGDKRSNVARHATPAANTHLLPECNALLTTPRLSLVTASAALAVVFAWAYSPTLMTLVQMWEREPDYSHGYFVVPLAVCFLWARRDRIAGTTAMHRIWPGIVLLVAGVALRYSAAAYYLEPLDGWSMLCWLAGIFWLLGGWKWLRWALPSIAFLIFMMPLPFRVERLMSYPLQRIAATMSGWMLQCFGLPALTQGNTILLGNQTLEVERACSGLTIFVGVAALAFAYVVLVRRSWWEKGLLIMAVLPIALVANATRIVLTGLLNEYATEAVAKKFSHDLAGWLMLPFAALLFAVALGYLGLLFPTAQQLDVRSMIRSQRTERPAGQRAT